MNEFVETARVALAQQRRVEVAPRDHTHTGDTETFLVTVFGAAREIECQCVADERSAASLLRAGAILRAYIGLGIHRHEMRELRQRADDAAARSREHALRIVELRERAHRLCEEVAKLVTRTGELCARSDRDRKR
jgi:hypothetical protein